MALSAFQFITFIGGLSIAMLRSAKDRQSDKMSGAPGYCHQWPGAPFLYPGKVK